MGGDISPSCAITPKKINKPVSHWHFIINYFNWIIKLLLSYQMAGIRLLVNP